MIDKKLEPYYDIMLSIFVGIFIILFLNSFYESPRTITIYDNNEEFNNIRKPCNINVKL